MKIYAVKKPIKLTPGRMPLYLKMLLQINLVIHLFDMKTQMMIPRIFFAYKISGYHGEKIFIIRSTWLGEIVGEHKKNLKTLMECKSEEIKKHKKQQIITIIFTTKAIDPDLPYSFRSTIPDDILLRQFSTILWWDVRLPI
jgi:hypothetical protein